MSVILVAYHSDRWIQACVESLRHASAERVHLLLVDNSGNARLDTLELDRFALERIATPEPLGFAEANNYALVNAERLGPFVLFLNQDTRSETAWIDACTQALEADPSLGAVSPMIRRYDGSEWDPSFLACSGPPHDWEDEDVLYRDLAPAPALIVRRDVLQKVGPFDPIFGSYYEDYDLCRRIQSAGYRIGFVRAGEIYHFSGSVTDSALKQRKRARLILRNRFIYALRWGRHSRGAAFARYLIGEVPHRLARGVLGRPGSQPLRVVLAATLDCLAVSPRMISIDRDERAWKRYLTTLNWPATLEMAPDTSRSTSSLENRSFVESRKHATP